jgi:hypothetical protein
MLFASKRRKATDAATAGLRPLIALAQSSGGMSLFMYQDPYVLGFLYTTAGLFARAETNEKASHADIGFAITDSFSNVSNHNGKALAELSAAYFEKANELTLKANEDAMVYFYYTFEIMQHEDEHPLIQSAKESAHFYVNSGLSSDYRSAVGAALLEETFLGRIHALRKKPDA